MTKKNEPSEKPQTEPSRVGDRIRQKAVKYAGANFLFFTCSIVSLLSYAYHGAPTTPIGIATLVVGVVGLIYNGVTLIRS